jgi:N-acetylneuraminic acid mutarotase
LTWSHSPDSDRAGYNLYRSTTLPVPTSTPVNTSGLLTGLTFTDTGRTNGTTYYYVLVTVDTSGNASVPTAPVSATPMAPAAPSGNPITWLTKASAAIARAEAGGVAVGNQLYVFGGQGGASGISQFIRSDRYDPATDTWTQIRDLPEPVTHAPVVADGNTLWIIGGYLGVEQKDSTTHVWKYDIPTDTYSPGPPLPAPRGGGGAALAGRELHYFSGANRRDSAGGETIDYPDHWVLNLDGGMSWTPSTPTPNPRNHLAAVHLNGTIYVIGGQHGPYEGTAPQQEVDAYDVASQTWTRKADLPVPRGHISASAFVWNGKIVTLGGSVVGHSAGLPSNTFYEYDPANDAWRTRTPLPGMRKSPVADLINDKFVVTGGRSSSGPTTTSWVGSDLGSWTTGPALPQTLLDAGGTELTGKIYVVGGKTSTGPISTVRVFDTATQTWGTAADLPGAAVENPAVVAYDGKLYSFAGSTGPFSGAVRTAHRYDPATNTWTPLPDMSVGRGGPAAVVLGTKVWLIGGMNAGASLASTEIFDLVSGTWSAGPPLATARDNPGAAVVGGRIYALGGRTRLSDGTEVAPRLQSMEVYDPAVGTWQAAPSMPTGRRAMAVGVINGRILAAGGERQVNGGTFPQNEEFDPVTNTWRALAPMVTPRHGAVGAVVAGRLHVIAGGTVGGSSYSDNHEIFTPPASSSPPDTTPPAAPTGLTAALATGPSVRLTWNANAEPDLASYSIYRSTSSPVSTSGPALAAVNPSAAPTFTDTTVSPDNTYFYVVVAKDTSGNASAASAEAPVIVPPGPPPPTTLKVRFSDANAVPPTGYLRDFGEAYGPRSGPYQGAGNSYGWVRVGTTTPLSLTTNGRLRTGAYDPLQLGLMHMQYQTTTPGSWEAAVPDGTYTVTVSVGDASYLDSTHQLSVEGQVAIAAFTPTSADRFRTATRTVSVADGRLTLSPEGGANTKVNYVEITSAS